MEFRSHVTGDLGDPSLDRGVDVLVIGDEDERPGGEFSLHLVECSEQLDYLVIGQQTAPAQAPHVGAGPLQVVDRQSLVVVEARRVLHDYVCRAAAQPAVPQGHQYRSPDWP